ncbi:HAD hydrolase-like protein [Uliginosibacterium sp. TH139]|uniref:HAD hydrolase-like protein n=1 Tax=Uliginosibacterium sp. TH139 TaxID=2067453 RepID=UPI000C7E458B|nr:HAD hydrolase-like protein [Uliginosibacterium sp. TH139]PLK47254.1 HAD family hydrolase [Uliginosibacterium sp. TH139]
MSKKHDFILFDLDGTLSDPLQGIGRSINYALAHFGYPERALDDLRFCVGPPLKYSFRELTGTDSDAHVRELIDKYRERYGDVGYAENTLYAGIPEALAAIDAAGIPMGLCTSKRADFAERILDLFGLRQHFYFVSGGDVDIHKWEQIAALVADGIVSRASLMVGDREVDIDAAHRNGLAAAGVLWGFGSHAELAAGAPRYLFSQPAEIYPALAG